MADRPLRELLDEVATRTPAPGGGSSAAWTCGLAAGLAEMAAGFALTPERSAEQRMEAIRRRARALREHALGLAERELSSYLPVLEALRLPGDGGERARRLESALSEATEAPLEIARVAAEIARLAEETARRCDPSVRGDAVVAVLLAEAASRAGACLVEINLSGCEADPRLGEARAAADGALEAWRAVLDEG